MYSDKEIIQSLKKAANILGKSPTSNEYRELGLKPSIPVMQRRFGTWNKAKEKAGVEFCPSELTPSYGTTGSGYLTWKYYDGEEKHQIYEHRLLSTLKVDRLEELKDNDVHHVDECKTNNSLKNIKVVDPREHSAKHSENQTRNDKGQFE